VAKTVNGKRWTGNGKQFERGEWCRESDLSTQDSQLKTGKSFQSVL
jgi:hypothetical protein